MKICKNCNAEFKPIHESRGQEQIYCCIKCRTESYKKRVINKELETKLDSRKIDSEIIYGTEQEILRQAKDITNRNINMERQRDNINPNRSNINDVNLEILEGKYQAKTEALEYKLKYENALEKIELANKRIFALEQELEEYDDDQDNGTNDMMGSVMTMAKNSPVLGDAIGKLLQNEKVHNFVVSLIPEPKENQ
jgi:hypothetical protein